MTLAERARIADALRSTAGNHVHAARLLGIARSTLWRKVKQFDERETFALDHDEEFGTFGDL